jgi:hypothetical protein
VSWVAGGQVVSCLYQLDFYHEMEMNDAKLPRITGVLVLFFIFLPFSSTCSFILHMRCGYLGSYWNLGLANDINWAEIACVPCLQ